MDAFVNPPCALDVVLAVSPNWPLAIASAAPVVTVVELSQTHLGPPRVSVQLVTEQDADLLRVVEPPVLIVVPLQCLLHFAQVLHSVF